MTAPPVTQAAMMRNTPGGMALALPSPLYAMLPAELQGRPFQWFAQPVNVLNLAPGVSATGNFTVDPAFTFAAWYGVVSIRSADNLTDRSTDPFTVSMSDTGNRFFNPNQTPLDIRTTFSTVGASSPAVWPAPLIVPGSTGINVTVTNLHNANTDNLRFAFMGILIGR